MNITGGSGADIAISATLWPRRRHRRWKRCASGETVVLFGGLPKNNPMTAMNANLIHYNEITVVGSFSYPAAMHEKALMVIRRVRSTPKNISP